MFIEKKLSMVKLEKKKQGEEDQDTSIQEDQQR
jgi:hypothetical protein